MAEEEWIAHGSGPWKESAHALQHRIRERFRVAVDRHRHWRAESNYSAALQRWALRLRSLCRDPSSFASSSSSSSASFRFYRKKDSLYVRAMHSHQRGDELTPLIVVLNDEVQQRDYVRDIHVMSFAFFFIFSAYGAAQNLESTLNAIWEQYQLEFCMSLSLCSLWWHFQSQRFWVQEGPFLSAQVASTCSYLPT